MAISPESYQRGIILSEEKTFLAPTSRLTANPINDAWDISYSWLNIEAALQQDGNYKDPLHDYVAYTFYLKNTGTETVPVKMTLDITSVHLGLDRAIRVLIIENDTIYKLYQLPDLVEATYIGMPEAIHFQSPARAFEEIINNFRPDQVQKYSFFLWLEGEDPDCTNEVRGGRIKMQMNFKIDDAKV